MFDSVRVVIKLCWKKQISCMTPCVLFDPWLRTVSDICVVRLR